MTGNEPPSSFDLDRYRALKTVTTYRPELDLVVLTPDGSPAASALGWYDDHSRSMLFEPVGTSPTHARRGLAQAVCAAVMTAAEDLGATQAVVGPRGDDAHPTARRLYRSLGFREGPGLPAGAGAGLGAGRACGGDGRLRSSP